MKGEPFDHKRKMSQERYYFDNTKKEWKPPVIKTQAEERVDFSTPQKGVGNAGGPAVENMSPNTINVVSGSTQLQPQGPTADTSLNMFSMKPNMLSPDQS